MPVHCMGSIVILGSRDFPSPNFREKKPVLAVECTFHFDDKSERPGLLSYFISVSQKS